MASLRGDAEKVRRRGGDMAFKVLSVESDTELTLAPMPQGDSPTAGATTGGEQTAAVEAAPGVQAAAAAGGPGEAGSSFSAVAGGAVGEASAAAAEDERLEWSFDVLGRVDQAAVFAKVLDMLRSGQCLGIFPEGGSSDRSWFTPGELLGLKVGACRFE